MTFRFVERVRGLNEMSRLLVEVSGNNRCYFLLLLCSFLFLFVELGAAFDILGWIFKHGRVFLEVISRS